MPDFKHISISDAHTMITKGNVAIADIRDPQSFEAAHVEGAKHLNNASLLNFTQEYEFATPVLVFCYHGNSSQGAAQFLVEQGFDEVYSVDGGFESWKLQFPYVSEQ